MTRDAASSTPNQVLYDLRTAAGLSQQDVAERISALAGNDGDRLGVTANTVSRWERGIIRPHPVYRRLLAELFCVHVEELGFALQREQPMMSARQPAPVEDNSFMTEDVGTAVDPRVANSQDAWRRTRRHMNAARCELTQLAATVYDPAIRLGATGLLTRPEWIPSEPVDLAAIKLTYQPDAAPPELDGTEAESSNVRPRATLVRRYQRYTQAIRDLDHPRLFDNRASWRMLDLEWSQAAGTMAFGPTSYFAGVDIYEALAHEMAYVHLDDNGDLGPGPAALRDLPFRKHIGDVFSFTRRPILPAISTLTIRAAPNDASFVLHRRDSRSVAVAGGMLQVIPSGIFQPSSVLPDVADNDFDLWRNIMREYSEELLGNPEHDGDGRPVRYDAEPFASLNQARHDGRIRVYCLGVALDALTLVGEILTVAIIDADTFDHMATDFVEVNDEGRVINTRAPFTESGIRDVLTSGRLAPAGAGCISLAWNHRDRVLLV